MRVMKDSGVPWVGEIPKNWRILRGKNILILLERPVKEDDGVITCFRDGEVTLRSNRREEGFTFSLQEIGYQGIEPGDLVVHGMDGFAGSIGISDSRGKATPVLNVMDSSESKKYLMYQLRTMAHCGLFFALSSGIRVRSCDTNWNKLKTIFYLVPPKEEQIRIVSFIDAKCAEIDSILENTQASIEDYKKLKQSVITEAVTKGIRGDRPMKDSGMIPETWGLTRHKYVMHKKKDICEHYSGQDIISLSMNGVIVRDLDAGGKMPTSFDGYQYVEPGTLLLCLFDIDVTPRCVGLVKNYGVTSPAYSKFIIHDGYAATYYDYLLRYIDDNKYFVHLAKNLRSSLTETDFGALPTIVPPLDEQQEIAAYLDEKCAAIDSLIASKEALITELEAYKKSMIYEYVTGKKEVPAV